MNVSGCFFPEDLLYSKDANLWFMKENNLLRMGLTSLYVWSFGKITKVRLREKGSKISANSSIGWLEGPTHFDSVRVPFECTLIEYNKVISENPFLINKSYYGDGWFALVRPEKEPDIVIIDEIKNMAEERIKQFRVRCFSTFPDIEMYEIGVECTAVLARLNETLSAYPSGTVVHIVSDDPTSGIELERWSFNTGNKVIESRKEDGLNHFLVKKV